MIKHNKGLVKKYKSVWYHERCKRTEFKRKIISTNKPILCFFCGKEITILNGSPHKDSLVIHSLDGNHQNWDDDNKVPAHHTCHASYSTTGITRDGEKHPMYGKHHTEESKRKIREANKGKNRSAETRQRMSESAKRRWSCQLLEESLQ